METRKGTGPVKASEADMEELGSSLPEVEVPDVAPTTTEPEVEGDIGEVAKYLGEPPVKMEKLRDPPTIAYQHSPDLTDDEMTIIITGLRGHIPLYAIAAKIKCSRSWLGKKIKEDPYLAEAYQDSREAYVDNLEFQAKRLIDQGNAAMIMFGLERLGKHRGWGQTDEDENREDDSKLVIGAIPEDMLSDADKEIAEASKGVPIVDNDGKIVSSVGIGDPMKMEMELERERSGIPPAVPPTFIDGQHGDAASSVVVADSVSEAPYDDGQGDEAMMPADYVPGPWDTYVMDD